MRARRGASLRRELGTCLALCAFAITGAVGFACSSDDGVTPDCSNPSACAPTEGDLDAGREAASESVDSGNGSTKDSGSDSGTDSGSDAGPTDADVDGG